MIIIGEVIQVAIWDALRDLMPFVQFKKHEKHPERSVTFRKLQAEACNFTKSKIPPWMFFTFGIKSHMKTLSLFNAVFLLLTLLVTDIHWKFPCA